MTDAELIARLRKQSSSGRANHVSKADRLAAADRIEALTAENAKLHDHIEGVAKDTHKIMVGYEAKLAKAVEALENLADRIEELLAKIKVLEKVEMYLKTSYPDKTGHYFICGEGGVKDDNGLPERLHICPAYGADWMMTYQRTDKTFGPEY